MHRVASLLCALCSIVSCTTDPADPEPDLRELLVEGIAASATGNPDIPYVAAHENGDVVAAFMRDGRLAGAVLLQTDGNHLTVFADEDGLPELAHYQRHIILYSNWRPAAVDIAVVAPDGSVQVQRDAAIPATGAFTSQLLLSASGADGQAATDLRTAISYASLVLGTAICVNAIILSAGVALPCGVAIIGAVSLATRDIPALEASSAALGTVAGVAGCAGGDPFSCAAAVTEGMGVALDATDAALESYEEAVRLARSALDTGGGDVQVTLTWDNTADLDLWVTDPDGVRIYFGNRSSPSGGRLDHDDRDGFGPENVFWPEGLAPRGAYLVQVDHFSGASPSGFRVLVQAFGMVSSYEGTTFLDQTVDVVRFESDQPLPLATPKTWSAVRQRFSAERK